MQEYIVTLKNVEAPIIIIAGKFEEKGGFLIFSACRRAIKNNLLCDAWFVVAMFSYDAIEGKIITAANIPLSEAEQENDDITVERCGAMMENVKNTDTTGLCTIRDYATEIIKNKGNYSSVMVFELDGKEVVVETVVTFIDGLPHGKQFY
jgi:hypothetical protein